jgi:hypothetical protein
MMEAARTSETSVDNYFTRQYIPEDKSELYIFAWSLALWFNARVFKLFFRRVTFQSPLLGEYEDGILRPDDGGSTHLLNVGQLQRVYTALNPRRLSSFPDLWLQSPSLCTCGPRCYKGG